MKKAISWFTLEGPTDYKTYFSTSYCSQPIYSWLGRGFYLVWQINKLAEAIGLQQSIS